MTRNKPRGPLSMHLAHHSSKLIRPKTLALAALLIATQGLVISACTQDEGQRCQLDSDCGDGLRCCYPITNPSPEELIAGGVCTPTDKCNTTAGTDSQIDGLALDSTKDDSAKDDSATDDSATDDSTTADSTTADSAKADSAKADSAKADSAKADSARPDTTTAHDTMAVHDTAPAHDAAPAHDTAKPDLISDKGNTE